MPAQQQRGKKKENFSTLHHFNEGLISGGHGHGDHEVLPINPPRAVMASIFLSCLCHWTYPLRLVTSLATLSRSSALVIRLVMALFFAALFFQGVSRVVKPLLEHNSSPHHTKPTTVLYTQGFYAHSRNPAYLLLPSLAVSAAFLTDSAWPLFAGVPLIMAYLNFLVVPQEEALLGRLFPDEYAAYCQRVRRWL